MVKVKTWYHGPFSDIVGLEHEDNILAERPTLADLFDALVTRYGDGFKEILLASDTGEISPGVVVLVNSTLCPRDTELKDGDEVAFLMALAGG
jgi:molybdopterin converting factor small subunit